jgi:ornithine racemase
MNRLLIDLEALKHNTRVVSEWVAQHGGDLTVVTKALCGHPEILQALGWFGVGSMGDSRIGNLRSIRENAPSAETWYLRPPHASALDKLLPLCDVSLNSEIATLREINAACRRTGRTHRVVLMLELGELREGVLPGKLLEMVESILEMPHITLLGLGANLGCLNGAIPMSEELTQLTLYHELLELKYGIKIPYVSAGTSAGLGLLRDGDFPKAINHFRVGEAILLGTDPVSGKPFDGLRSDGVKLEAEVVELKEKRLVPSIETAKTPFDSVEEEEEREPGERGYRAIVTVGHVDTDVGGLTPLDSDHAIAGASSDVTVVNLGPDRGGVALGDTLAFRPDYSAFVRLMNNPYTTKKLVNHPAAYEPSHPVVVAPGEPIGDDARTIGTRGG